MAEVEEEMLHMDEEVNDELAEVEHLLDEDELNAPFFCRPAPIQIFGLRESKPRIKTYQMNPYHSVCR